MFGRDHTELKLREQELASRLDDLNTSEALKTAIVDHALAALVTTAFTPAFRPTLIYGIPFMIVLTAIYLVRRGKSGLPQVEEGSTR